MKPFVFKQPSVIPGFGITMGFTLFYLLLVVVIPLAGLFVSASALSWQQFVDTVTNERVMVAYRNSFGIAMLAAMINCVFGLILAWTLVRYEFPGKKLIDALVDLPIALPTAVAGIALTAIYAPGGWVGQYLESLHIGLILAPLVIIIAFAMNFWIGIPFFIGGLKFCQIIGEYVGPISIKVAFTPLGILVALMFVGLPFVVRTVEPVLKDFERELEEAASSLGANRFQIFWHVILPSILPALLTGFAMAFARGLGEYGSVIFIAGNLPYVSEIVPLYIVIKLEQYDMAGATAIASVMLISSFILLFIINWLQRWSRNK